MVYLPSIVSVGYYFEKKRALATGIAVCGSGIGTFIFAPLSEYLLQVGAGPCHSRRGVFVWGMGGGRGYMCDCCVGRSGECVCVFPVCGGVSICVIVVLERMGNV